MMNKRMKDVWQIHEQLSHKINWGILLVFMEYSDGLISQTRQGNN